jgi:hypothetical protein
VASAGVGESYRWTSGGGTADQWFIMVVAGVMSSKARAKRDRRVSVEAERERAVNGGRLRQLSTGGWSVVNEVMMRKGGRAATSHAMAVSNFTGKAKAHTVHA